MEIPLLPLESLFFIIPIVIKSLSIIPIGIILLFIYAESKYSQGKELHRYCFRGLEELHRGGFYGISVDTVETVVFRV